MIAIFGAYIKTITALTIFSALACMLMPDGSFRKYVELVLGILILTAVLSPFLKLFGAEPREVAYGGAFEEIVREDVATGTVGVIQSTAPKEQDFAEKPWQNHGKPWQ